MSSDESEVRSSIVESLALLIEQMQPIKEAVTGYKAQLVNDGWGDAAAEKMAVELHNALIRRAFTP